MWRSSGPSPIDNMLKRNGSMIHHLCYVADDPEAALAGLAAAGLDVRPISAVQAAVLFGGRDVFFYSVNDVTLIEFIHGESPART
jgi:hypothetical protein